MSSKSFYITTTLPYVNAEPHIGFAMEIIRADIIARSKKLAGYDVFFNTGTDEHGVKIFRKAVEQGIEPQKYVDNLAQKYKELLPILGITPDVNFIRTTDEHHKKSAQEFWKIVDKNGFIYKKKYQTKYCVGCELEKTDSELLNGRCSLHPLQDLELIDEENYFFKFSAFGEKLLNLYETSPSLVIPDFRYNEIKSFVKMGLQDFSVSRLASKMKWGIPVPGDPDQVMYVWFDALVNYISAIGWPDRKQEFDKWWMDTGGVVQYCGKDNLRQQSAMWQAMLMASGITPSKNIIIDGFITGEGGIKMSKSLGNVVSPLDIVKEYGTDALRFYVVKELSPFEDSPFTMEKFKESYNAHLANGIGNLTSRVLKMAETHSVWAELQKNPVDFAEFDQKFASFDIKKVCDEIWHRIETADKFIAENQPFKVIKIDKKKGEEMLSFLVAELWNIAHMITPILPATAETLKRLIAEKKSPVVPLFARK